ncbi:MAG: hypothetical protein FWD25_09235, partial [Clostridia bacterium]|nr:hypothetical protein [Clostridia bacterium]
MVSLFGKRFVSMMLVFLLIVTAMPAHGYAFDAGQKEVSANGLINTNRNDDPESEEHESESGDMTAGDPGGNGAGGSDNETSEGDAEASEDNAEAGEGDAEASEDNAEASEDNAEAGEDNAEADEGDAEAGEGDAEAGDTGNKADDGANGGTDGDATTSENQGELKEELEEAPNYYLRAFPSVDAFMFTGNAIAPEFQVVAVANGAVVASSKQEDEGDGGWKWSGDLSGQAVGEYTVIVTNAENGEKLSLAWKIEVMFMALSMVMDETPEYILTSAEGDAFQYTGGWYNPLFQVFQVVEDGENILVASSVDGDEDWVWSGIEARNAGNYTVTAINAKENVELTYKWKIVLMPLAGLEGELNNFVSKIQGAIAPQNFGTVLDGIKYKNSGVDTEWVPSNAGIFDMPAAIRFTSWYPSPIYLTPEYADVELILAGSKMHYYIGGTTGRAFYDFEDFKAGKADGSVWKCPVTVSYMPQPVQINYTEEVQHIIYGQKLPGVAVFHTRIANDHLLTEDMNAFALSGLRIADRITGAFAASWVKQGWVTGMANKDIVVDTYEEVITIQNSRPHYYVAVTDKGDSSRPLTAETGGTLVVEPCPVTYGWALPSSAPHTGKAYEQIIELCATDAVRSLLDLKNDWNLPFGQNNKDLNVTVNVYFNESILEDKTLVTFDPNTGLATVKMTELGDYKIVVAIANGNYVLNEGIKNFSIVPRIIDTEDERQDVYVLGVDKIPDSYD